MSTITRQISTLPEPPSRQRPATFSNEADAFLAALPDFTDDVNTVSSQMNTVAGEVNTNATTASNSAATATAQAVIATTKASEALISANNAYTSEANALSYANSALDSKNAAAASALETANKVTKVTSTDNAVVRFNGTTGEVQNSGVVVDDNGNVGIGVTPSGWGSDWKAIDASGGGAFAGAYNSAYMLSNAYYSASGGLYKATGTAGHYGIENGSHIWKTAPSGTAGNTITWTNAMTLDSSGNVGIGNNSPDGTLHIVKSVDGANSLILENRYSSSTNASSLIKFYTYRDVDSTNYVGYIGAKHRPGANGDLNQKVDLVFGTDPDGSDDNPTERMKLTSSGNLLVGTTTDNGVDKLQVNGSISALATNSKEFIISKTGSTGIFDFTKAELGKGIYDNSSYLLFITVHRPTEDTSADVGNMLVTGIMPRGGNSIFSTINTMKGAGITTLTAGLLNTNDLRITTDSGVNFRCIIKAIVLGGIN